MKLATLLPVILLSNFCLSQNNINVKLKDELLFILSTDQGIREYLVGNPSETRRDSLAALLKLPKDSIEKNGWGIMNTIDYRNLERIEKIIEQYGYPGKSLVGEPANTAAFLLFNTLQKLSTIFH